MYAEPTLGNITDREKPEDRKEEMAEFDNSKDDEEKGEEQAPIKVFDWMPPNLKPLADAEYDAIVMGTGICLPYSLIPSLPH